MEQKTSLQLPRPVLEALRARGAKGQTYAEIIMELLEGDRRRRWADEQVRIAREARFLRDKEV